MNYLNFEGLDQDDESYEKVNTMGYYHLEEVPYSSIITTNADTSVTETIPN